ncbi:MAG: hypothetical protein ACRD0W_16735 [Acidimicrobiales bacterium]
MLTLDVVDRATCNHSVAAAARCSPRRSRRRCGACSGLVRASGPTNSLEARAEEWRRAIRFGVL